MTLAVNAPATERSRASASRLVGPVYLAVHSVRPIRERLSPWIRGHREIDAFSPTGRGLGPKVVLAQAARLRDLQGSTAMILGVGAAAEADLLTEVGVEHIVGTDLETHTTKWRTQRARLAGQGVATTFTLMDGAQLGLAENSLDLVFSQSVLEHVVDMGSMLSEARRVLRPDGLFVAWFGPIWTTFGGPHVTELAYDHLLVDDRELCARARRVGDGWEHWLENGLFNRFAYQQYLDAFAEHFDIEWLAVAGSGDGAAYRDEHPAVWERLLENYTEFDLLTRLVGVVAKPR